MAQTQLRPEYLARKLIDEHLQKTGWKSLKQYEKVPSNGFYYLPEEEVKNKFAYYGSIGIA